MTRVVNRDELRTEPFLLDEIKKSIFIYPTDTIYGIGCDATNPLLVDKLRKLKQNFDRPFPIIIPDTSILETHCKLTGAARQWVEKLPGPYTLILQYKKTFFAYNVTLNEKSIAVRIPDNWFYDVVKSLGVPVVTTSANRTGDEFMTSLEDLAPEIKKGVDYIIYDGPIKGKPSTIVHLEKPQIAIKIRS